MSISKYKLVLFIFVGNFGTYPGPCAAAISPGPRYTSTSSRSRPICSRQQGKGRPPARYIFPKSPRKRPPRQLDRLHRQRLPVAAVYRPCMPFPAVHVSLYSPPRLRRIQPHRRPRKGQKKTAHIGRLSLLVFLHAIKQHHKREEDQ